MASITLVYPFLAQLAAHGGTLEWDLALPLGGLADAENTAMSLLHVGLEPGDMVAVLEMIEASGLVTITSRDGGLDAPVLTISLHAALLPPFQVVNNIVESLVPAEEEGA